MTPICSREQEVVDATIKGYFSTSLSGHLDSCESCRAAATMTALLRKNLLSADESTVDMDSSEIVWMRAVSKQRSRQKRMRKLGLPLGVAAGVVVSYVISVIIMPSKPVITFERLESLLSHSPPFLWSVVLVLLALLLVLIATPTIQPVSGKH